MVFKIFISFPFDLNHLSRGFHAFVENISSLGVVPTTGVEPVEWHFCLTGFFFI